MLNQKIPIARTSLTEEEIQSVLEPLRSGWLVQGHKVRNFEEKWSAFTGTKHSVAVTSCTSALQLSLAALGFRPGDEAIIPAFTWIATANVVEHLGGKVVFCDINLETFNIDINQIESKISPKTKVIIPVHLFGFPADMEAISSIAKHYNLKVVEDAACGFGARYKGQHVGAMGDAGCFSFHPRKAITTGEGGMITTQDDDLAQKLRQLRDHGAAIGDLQRHIGPKPYLLSDHSCAGYNFRMTDIQAALGAAQMERATEIQFERKFLGNNYNKSLSGLDWIMLPKSIGDYEHGYQSYACMYRPEEINIRSIPIINRMRNYWMEELYNSGISTRPATHAVHMLEFYRKKYRMSPEDMPNAYAANECSISFPLFHGITTDEQDYVIKKIKEHRK